MRAFGAVLFATIALSIAGCQSRPAATIPQTGGKSAALRNMEHVATLAYRCWFSSRDNAFRGYSFANELNSFTGRPRFLLVPRNNFGGKPLLVVQAEGPSGQVTQFGPLLQGAQGGRISADINRWATGATTCSASA